MFMYQVHNLDPLIINAQENLSIWLFPANIPKGVSTIHTDSGNFKIDLANKSFNDIGKSTTLIAFMPKLYQQLFDKFIKLCQVDPITEYSFKGVDVTAWIFDIWHVIVDNVHYITLADAWYDSRTSDTYRRLSDPEREALESLFSSSETWDSKNTLNNRKAILLELENAFQSIAAEYDNVHISAIQLVSDEEAFEYIQVLDKNKTSYNGAYGLFEPKLIDNQLTCFVTAP